MKRSHPTESEHDDLNGGEEKKSDPTQSPPPQQIQASNSNCISINGIIGNHEGNVNIISGGVDDDDDDDDKIVEMTDKIHTNGSSVPEDDDDDDDDDDDGDLMGFGSSAAYQYAPGVLGFIPVEDQIKFSGLLCSQKQTPPTPLSKYRLLGNSGLRVSPRKYNLLHP